MNNKKEFLRVSDDFTDKYKLSQYNIYLDAKEGLVYNTVSQAVATFETKTIDDEVVEACLENGFVVNRDLNELDELKKEYDSITIFYMTIAHVTLMKQSIKLVMKLFKERLR